MFLAIWQETDVEIDEVHSNNSWYELAEDFLEAGSANTAESDFGLSVEEGNGEDNEDGESNREESEGDVNGGDDDDNAAAFWDEGNEDVDVPVFTGKTGLQIEPPVAQIALSFSSYFVLRLLST